MAIEEAVVRLMATLAWLRKHRFMAAKELRRWHHLVRHVAVAIHPGLCNIVSAHAPLMHHALNARASLPCWWLHLRHVSHALGQDMCPA